LESNLLQPKPPTQDRGRARVALIRDEALALLEHQEIDQISISELAKKSGVGVGTFYHYYPSKEALVLDLRNLILKETATSLAEEFQSPIATKKDFILLFQKLVNEWLAALIKVKNLERAVWAYAFTNPDFALALRSQETGLRILVQGILETYQSSLRPANLDTVAATLVMWVDGTMSRVLRDESLIQDHQWLVEELTRMLGHYIFPDGVKV
jgi:AcrR family transcriptional regulator